jgi:hypothetical protein
LPQSLWFDGGFNNFEEFNNKGDSRLLKENYSFDELPCVLR